MTAIPALTPEATIHPCPVKTCGPSCHACQGNRRVHLSTELQGPSVQRVLEGIRRTADMYGESLPGAYLYPDGQVVYGVKTGRRVIDQAGQRPPPRLRLVKSA